MADPRFGFSLGPYSADFNLSDAWTGLKEEVQKELERRSAAMMQSAPVQALQSLEFRTPLGTARPFGTPQAPIPPPPAAQPQPAPKPQQRYAPPKPASAFDVNVPPSQLGAIPSPTGGAPRVVDPGKLYQAIGSDAYEPPAYVEPTTVVQAEPMEAPPSAQAQVQQPPQGHRVDWRALLAALQPVAQGFREPSTTRPYARLGYFHQLEQEQARDQQIKLQQMAQDAAMARQEAENRARAEWEREQSTAALEREQMSEQAALERARLQAQTETQLREHPLTAEQAAAMGLPPGMVGSTPALAEAYLRAKESGAAQASLAQYRTDQTEQDRLRNLEAQRVALENRLRDPLIMMDPMAKASAEAELAEVKRQLNPMAALAGSQGRASAMTEGPEAAQYAADQAKIEAVKNSPALRGLGDQSRRIVLGALFGEKNPVNQRRVLEQLAKEAPPDEKVIILRLIAGLGK